jgi:hypothetical protein
MFSKPIITRLIKYQMNLLINRVQFYDCELDVTFYAVCFVWETHNKKLIYTIQVC